MEKFNIYKDGKVMCYYEKVHRVGGPNLHYNYNAIKEFYNYTNLLQGIVGFVQGHAGKQDTVTYFRELLEGFSKEQQIEFDKGARI